MSKFCADWKELLVIVQPDTVAQWHRRGFRLYWRSISKPGPGRTPIPAEVHALIRRFAHENRRRVRKVRAELEKLGIFVGISTVARTLPKRDPDRDRRPRWNTFLRNHRHDIAAIDFLAVPSAGLRLLYAWFVISHGRREVIHFGVTEHPTSSWVMQQLPDTFPGDTAPRSIIFDNDPIFSNRVAEPIEDLGIEPWRTAFRSPWQNGITGRGVGSARRELLDHAIVLNEDHLQRILREYVEYYNVDRVHKELRDSPKGAVTQCRPSSKPEVVSVPKVGRLHHRYEWREAA